MSLTVKDLENLQAHYSDYQMELIDGKIVVMSPSGYESDKVAFRVGANLWNWEVKHIRVEAKHHERAIATCIAHMEEVSIPVESILKISR